MKDERDAARELLAFLARAYTFKQIGDYAVGQDASVSDTVAAMLGLRDKPT